ncbi:MAG: sodium/hydrogen exchanger [Methanolobus sp. T82-4]|nr:MAG: sodium/hydrogen exchanger [Methanolobus sp. T82-4]
MEVLFQILLILLFARLLGEATERLGLLSIVGEITAGFMFALLLRPTNTEVFGFFAELGAIFLLFTAGYREVHLKDLEDTSIKALIPTVFQIFVSFSFGFLIGRIFGFGYIESLFMAVAFSPTSISVVIRTLIDSDYLSSKTGSLMLTSTIFDDIIGIFLLSIVVSLANTDQLLPGASILGISLRIITFVVLMLLLGLKILPFAFGYIQKMHTRESLFSFVIIVALFCAYLSQVFGLHAAIGAFLGGVILSDLPFAKIDVIQKEVNGLAYGLFTPLFFAFIGFSVEMAINATSVLFAISVVVMALLAKLIGGFVGTKLIGFDNMDSLIFGVGMMPRAGVELVIISIGRQLGVIREEIFSAIVLMVIVSIILSPFMLERAIRYKESIMSSMQEPVSADAGQ